MALMLLALLAAAQPAARIAVLQIQGARLTPEEAVQITEALHHEAAAAAKAEGGAMIGTSELSAALESAGIDPAHCEDECVADAARAAKADYVLSGRASKMGKAMSLLLMFHSQDGGLVGSTQVRGESIDALDAALGQPVKDLIHGAAKKWSVAKAPAQPPPAQAPSSAWGAPKSQPPPAPRAQSAATPAAVPAAAVTAAPETNAPPKRAPWFVAGAVALAGGLAMDTIPDSAHDHKMTGADFVPLALYAVGVTALLIGVTR